MTLEEIKLYLKVDTEDDDTLLQSLLLASEEYLLSCGIDARLHTTNLYELATKMLVCHWYDNRDAVLVGSISKNLEYSLDSIIFKLKLKVVQ